MQASIGFGPRLLLRLVGVVIILLVLVAAALAWRLSLGPIDIDFLTPYFEEAITPEDGSRRVVVGHTTLNWRGGGRPIAIRVERVAVFEPEAPPGTPALASLDEADLTIDFAQLFKGRIRPLRISVYGPQLFIDPSDGLQVRISADESPNDEQVPRVFQELLDPPSPLRRLGLLTEIEIVDGELHYFDPENDVDLVFRDFDMVVRRGQTAPEVPEDGARLTGHASVTLGDRSDGPRVVADLVYADKSDSLSFSFAFRNVESADIAAFHPALDTLKALDARLSGQARLWVHEGEPTTVLIDADSSPGHLSLAAWQGGNLPIAGGSLSVSAELLESRLRIERLTVDLAGPATGASLAFEGDVTGDVERGTYQVEMSGRSIPNEALPLLWPPRLAHEVRNWVLGHVSGGRYPDLNVSLAGHWTGEGRIGLDDAVGAFRFEDLAVRVLDALPNVRGVSGKATVTKARFDAEIEAGWIGATQLRSGTLAVTGLDVGRETADIEVITTGPISSALTVIDVPELGYATALDLVPQDVAGQLDARLHLRFPLLDDLRLEDIGIGVGARLTGVRLNREIAGHRLDDADLLMMLDGNGMQLSGKAQVGELAADVMWRERFSPEAGDETRAIEVETVLPDGWWQKAADLEGIAATGPVPVQLRLTANGDAPARLVAEGRLGEMRIALPQLGWTKEAGVPGSAELVAELDGWSVSRLERIRVEAAGLELDAGGRWDEARRSLSGVDLRRLVVGRTDIAGTLTLPPNGTPMAVDLIGRSLDLAPLLAREDEEGVDEIAPPLSLRMDVGRLYLDDTRSIENVTGTIEIREGEVRQAAVEARFPDGGVLTGRIDPVEGGRELDVVSPDFGAMLTFLEIEERVVGGKAHLTGFWSDNGAGEALRTRLKVGPFSVRRAPILARILDAAALVGLGNLLDDDGIAFDGLEADAHLSDEALVLDRFLASGVSLGITAKGRAEIDGGRLDLTGTLSPFYVVNRALSEFPVLGDLLSGGSGEEGMFAAEFTVGGTVKEPDIQVYPLTALAPGFIRKLFTLTPVDEDPGLATPLTRPIDR